MDRSTLWRRAPQGALALLVISLAPAAFAAGKPTAEASSQQVNSQQTTVTTTQTTTQTTAQTTAQSTTSVAPRANHYQPPTDLFHMRLSPTVVFEADGTLGANLGLGSGYQGREEASDERAVASVGADLTLDLSLRQLTLQERGQIPQAALLPGVGWADRWGASLSIDASANHDRWRVDERGEEVVFDRILGEYNENDVAWEHELRVALGVGELTHSAGWQRPVSFDDMVWLNTVQRWEQSWGAVIPGVISMGELRVGEAAVTWTGVHQRDARLDFQTDELDTVEEPAALEPDNLERSALEGRMALFAHDTHEERTGLSFRALEGRFRFWETELPDYIASQGTANFWDAEGWLFRIERAGDDDGEGIVVDASLGVSAIMPLHVEDSFEDDAPATVFESPDADSSSSEASVGAAWQIGVERRREDVQVRRPWENAGGATNAPHGADWRIQAGSFHRLSTDATHTDYGVRFSGERTLEGPLETELRVAGNVVVARGAATSRLIDLEERTDGSWFVMTRADAELRRPFFEHGALFANAFVERSDRDDARITGNGHGQGMFTTYGLRVGAEMFF